MHFYTRIGSVLSAWNESTVTLSEHGCIIFYGNRNIQQLYKNITRSEFFSDSKWRAHEQLWKDEKEYHIFSGPEGTDAMAAELWFLYEWCLKSGQRNQLLAYLQCWGDE